MQFPATDDISVTDIFQAINRKTKAVVAVLNGFQMFYFQGNIFQRITRSRPWNPQSIEKDPEASSFLPRVQVKSVEPHFLHSKGKAGSRKQAVSGMFALRYPTEKPPISFQATLSFYGTQLENHCCTVHKLKHLQPNISFGDSHSDFNKP